MRMVQHRRLNARAIKAVRNYVVIHLGMLMAQLCTASSYIDINFVKMHHHQLPRTHDSARQAGIPLFDFRKYLIHAAVLSGRVLEMFKAVPWHAPQFCIADPNNPRCWRWVRGKVSA